MITLEKAAALTESILINHPFTDWKQKNRICGFATLSIKMWA